MGTADTIMVSNVGAAAMSAVSLVDSINVLVIQAFSALAAGGCIICSQYIGKEKPREAEKAAKQVLLAVFFIAAVITVLCMVSNRGLLRLVFGQVEEDVMEAAVIYFYYTALSFPFIGLYDAGAAIYRAQGNSRLPMTVSVISNFLNIIGNAIFIWGFHMGVAGAACILRGGSTGFSSQGRADAHGKSLSEDQAAVAADIQHSGDWDSFRCREQYVSVR